LSTEDKETPEAQTPQAVEEPQQEAPAEASESDKESEREPEKESRPALKDNPIELSAKALWNAWES